MKTLNVVCVLFVMIFPVAISIAQPHPPDSLWSQTYGGHTLYGVQQTPDGGYILAGWEGSGGYDADFYAIKTRADGSAQWTRVFGTPYNEMCFSVQQTFDNSYVLGGYSYYELFASDMWLIKMNANGDSLWGRSYRGVFDENICYAVEQTTDTGYILAGCTGYSDGEEWNVLLVKTDSSGNSIWTREYLIGYSSLCNSVQQTSDGGYILAGYAHIIINTNYAKVLLMKTDEDGDSLWSHVYGGDRFNVSYSVAQTSDGGYILAGYTNSYGSGYTDFWLMKTDENGDSSWSRTYGGAHADACFSLQQTSDGGYILAGSTSSFGNGDTDFWLVRTNANGDSLW
ncbi:hypothetical protein KKB28_05800, partial [bacterium]|nr:hypothetical protein [bacterium]